MLYTRSRTRPHQGFSTDRRCTCNRLCISQREWIKVILIYYVTFVNLRLHVELLRNRTLPRNFMHVKYVPAELCFNRYAHTHTHTYTHT